MQKDPHPAEFESRFESAASREQTRRSVIELKRNARFEMLRRPKNRQVGRIVKHEPVFEAVIPLFAPTERAAVRQRLRIESKQYASSKIGNEPAGPQACQLRDSTGKCTVDRLRIVQVIGPYGCTRLPLRSSCAHFAGVAGAVEMAGMAGGALRFEVAAGGRVVLAGHVD